jgi:hypothetical protein
MGVIEDMFKALDRIPIWKRLQTVPDEVDALKAKVAALEEKLGGKYPADACKFCGARACRMTASFGANAKGRPQSHWTCSDCGRVETRVG